MTPPDRAAWRSLPADMTIAHWPAADGWPLRRFDRPAPAGTRRRGSLLFQGGRGDFIEKYVEALGHWHARGWALTGFDWRGQGGSGRFLSDPAIGHAPSLDPLLDDLAGYVDRWLVDAPGPHVLIGHSMGGHLILRLLAERRPAVTAAVLVAPMLGFATGSLPPWAAGMIARAALLAGRGERAAWRDGDRPGGDPIGRQRNLTHSAERYADEQYWKAQMPEIGVGAPSWGWLAASIRSMAETARAGRLEGVQTPILILAAPGDRLVSTPAIRAAVARLPHGRLIEYAGSAHEILREADGVRLPALAAIDAFLDEAAP